MAITKTARFQVRPDAVDEARALIEEFTRAVGENEPGTLFYIAVQDANEPTRFLHVFAFTDAAAEALHRETAWVKRFTEALYPATVDGVEFSDVHLVATTTR